MESSIQQSTMDTQAKGHTSSGASSNNGNGNGNNGSDDNKQRKPVRSVSRRACLSCREKKIKCDGVQVCRNCEQVGIDCVFVKSHRGGRRTVSKQSQASSGPSPGVVAAAQQYASSASTTPQGTVSSGQYFGNTMPSPHSAQPPRHDESAYGPYHHNSSTELYHNRTYSLPSLVSIDGYSQQQQQLPPPPQQHPPQPQPQQQPQQQPQPQAQAQHQPHPHSAQVHPQPQRQPTPQRTPQQHPPTLAPVQGSYAQTNVSENLRQTLVSLQTQIDQIRSRLPLCGPLTSVGVPNWQVTEQDLTVLDLPPSEVCNHFVDIYYDFFHPNHPILYPKPAFFKYLKLSTEVGLVHAMFSISCRFVADAGVPRYMKDPQYWIAKAKKYVDSLSSTEHVKAWLLIGIGLQASGDNEGGYQYLHEADRIVEAHRLSTRHTAQAGIDREVEAHALAIATTAQLLDRESLIRTLWECWRCKVQIGVWKQSPESIPLLNSNLCVPVADIHYETELRDWDRKRVFWSDFETDLLSISGETNIDVTKFRSFYDTSLLVAATQVMTAATRMTEMRLETLSSLNSRIRTIDRVISAVPEGSMTPHQAQTIRFARFILYGTTIMSHSAISRGALVYVPNFDRINVPRDGGTESLGYTEQTVEQAHEKLKDGTINHSFQLCAWASKGLKDMLVVNGNSDFAENEQVQKRWLALPELFGHSIEFAMVLLATLVLFQQRYGDDQHHQLPAVSPQDLRVCMAYLETLAPIWNNLDISRQRARLLYDKTLNQLKAHV